MVVILSIFITLAVVINTHINTHIEISISKQALMLFQDDRLVKQYSVSTAKNGAGQESGTGQTPLGHHVIRAKIGADQPECAVFVGRRFTGEVYSESLAEAFPERDWILSRILWLSGKEVGVIRLGSVDSMRRYIYIHGTPDTEPMGVPLSHGCVRMRNKDVVEVFELIQTGCLVDIQR